MEVLTEGQDDECDGAGLADEFLPHRLRDREDLPQPCEVKAEQGREDLPHADAVLQVVDEAERTERAQRDDQPLAEQDISDLCEVREPFLSEERDYGRRVIFGHTPFATPLLTPFRTGIDTGAVYGNLLTAVELPGLRFHHA